MTRNLTTGSFQLMKSLNRSTILNFIREKGPISRAEIAKLTGLTPPTVSNLVKELLSAEMVMEREQGESSGGRKPTMLVINKNRYFVVGLDVGSSNIKGVLTNLDGEILKQDTRSINKPISKEDLLNYIKNAVRELIKQVNEDDVIGIGIGMHGVVDIHEGVSLYAPNLGLENTPIKEELEKEFNMLVKVDNDVRTMALGELWFGNGTGAESMVCVNLGRGIGAGVIIGGKLFYGHHFISGEVGHMTIDMNGPKCSCGNYGCLQTFASGPAIAEKAKSELKLGKESVLSRESISEITGEMITDAAKKGDSLSQKILAETGKYIGIGITNLIHTFNPATIVLGGGVSQAGHFILEHVKETINDRVITESAKKTEIVLSKLNGNATAIGAVTLILVELFYSKNEVD